MGIALQRAAAAGSAEKMSTPQLVLQGTGELGWLDCKVNAG
jgi:hypothetical protein